MKEHHKLQVIFTFHKLVSTILLVHASAFGKSASLGKIKVLIIRQLAAL